MKGTGQRQRFGFQRDLIFLHDLQQRALRLGRCAIDLIREQYVGKHRSAHDSQLTRRDVQDGMTRDIRRHQVGRELNPCHVQRHGLR